MVRYITGGICQALAISQADTAARPTALPKPAEPARTASSTRRRRTPSRRTARQRSLTGHLRPGGAPGCPAARRSGRPPRGPAGARCAPSRPRRRPQGAPDGAPPAAPCDPPPAGRSRRPAPGSRPHRPGVPSARPGSPGPTAHLDGAAENQVLAAVSALRAAGRTVLLVAHRPALLAAATGSGRGSLRTVATTSAAAPSGERPDTSV